MGFMNFLGKMIKGEPVFEAPQDEESHHDDRPVIDPGKATEGTHSSHRLDSHGNKFLPTIGVGSVENHFSGSRNEIWITIKNTSSFVLGLDKIRCFNQTTELDHQLEVGQEREFKVYRGERLANNYYHTAEIYYKDVQTGDYFCAQFQIEYKYESDNTYSPEEFKLINPIKDV